MITILHPSEFESASAGQIASLGLAHHTFNNSNITELTHATCELVYMLPIQAMDAESWSRLRVEFARGNRPYIVWLNKPTTKDVARAMRDGAHDVLSIEDSDDRWRQAMLAVAENQKVWLQLYGGRPLSADDVLLGCSDAIQRLQLTIDRLGPTDVCVLIQGESGVGKERVASALHKASHDGPFIALNCAAIPKDLIEAELFGVERGAFTGALKARPGLVEQANGGTLFLDEVGEMELGVQPKLLRFLETHKARRVGGEAEYRVEVRVVSASNRNLDAEIAENRFRPDLYYRLGEIILQVPPLRARPEDIAELARAFMMKANERFGKNFETLEPALIMHFQQYSWPGNVRELKSTIDRMVLLFDGPILRAPWWDMPDNRQSKSIAALPALQVMPTLTEAGTESEPGAAAPPLAFGAALPNTKQKLAMAKKMLAESDDNYSWVAGQLGVNSSTLWRWRKAGKLD
ncbi:MAG: sigma-54 dependent transcriptional regulator [Verrucomicrobiota bacterium]